ncbi:hypothetical protein [Bacteroides sedimenti]|uniref:hypothetical protein n=1 Tax=Bacteroides sedimenti TaxID=2136147 RepID=UPI00333E88BF
MNSFVQKKTIFCTAEYKSFSNKNKSPVTDRKVVAGDYFFGVSGSTEVGTIAFACVRLEILFSGISFI